MRSTRSCTFRRSDRSWCSRCRRRPRRKRQGCRPPCTCRRWQPSSSCRCKARWTSRRSCTRHPSRKPRPQRSRSRQCSRSYRWADTPFPSRNQRTSCMSPPGLRTPTARSLRHMSRRCNSLRCTVASRNTPTCTCGSSCRRTEERRSRWRCCSRTCRTCTRRCRTTHTCRPSSRRPSSPFLARRSPRCSSPRCRALSTSTRWCTRALPHRTPCLRGSPLETYNPGAHRTCGRRHRRPCSSRGPRPRPEANAPRERLWTNPVWRRARRPTRRLRTIRCRFLARRASTPCRRSRRTPRRTHPRCTVAIGFASPRSLDTSPDLAADVCDSDADVEMARPFARTPRDAPRDDGAPR
jgi:hypothetical protein